MSLNSNKCIVGVSQEKLLGYVVSKEGISIDPKRVKAIKKLSLPVNKKGLQSFIGKINFMSRFITDFVGLVRPITLMLKKDQALNGPKRLSPLLTRSKKPYPQPLCWLTPTFQRNSSCMIMVVRTTLLLC